MTSRTLSACVLGAVALGAACTASRPPQQVTVQSSGPLEVAKPALPAPEELPVMLVAGNLERDVFAVLERLEPGNQTIGLIRAGWRTLLAARLGDGLAMALDGSAPLVIGMGSGPAEGAPLVGVAGLLPNKRDTVGQSYDLVDLGRGLSRLVPRLGSPEGNPIGRELECALLAVAGQDLIACAPEADWIPKYARHVAVRQREAASDAALRLEIRGRMLKSPEQVLSAELQSQAARAGFLSTLELMAAMRDLQAELKLVEGGYRLSLEFSLRPVSDSLAAILVAPPPTEERLPPPFLALPADATMAFTSRGVHPDQMAEVADRFWTMMLASLSENQPDPRWAELVSLARKVLMRGGALVGAYGHDAGAALAALDAERARKRPRDERIHAALADYWLLGVEEDAGQVQEVLDGLLELEARDAARRTAAGKPPGPRLSRVKPHRRDRLPDGATLLRLDRPATPDTRAEQRYLALASRDGWVWLCGSRDRGLATERLRGVLAGERHASMERLLLLRRPGVLDAVAFGFVTPAAVVTMDLPRGGDALDIEQAHARLQALAAQGDAATAPMTLSYTHAEGENGYRRARLVGFVPDSMAHQLPRPAADLATVPGSP